MAKITAVVTRPKGSVALPDKAGWTNRFEIKSSSSNRVYVIAQNINGRHWGCSCPGWLTRRKCKHLQGLGLPCFEAPLEVTLK